MLGFVRNSKSFSAFSSSRGKHSSSIMGGHSFSKTVLVFSFPLRWLVSPFHWGNVFLSLNSFSSFRVRKGNLFFFFAKKLLSINIQI